MASHLSVLRAVPALAMEAVLALTKLKACPLTIGVFKTRMLHQLVDLVRK
jgi:hypothetical protein